MNFKTLLNNYPRQSVQNFNIKNYNLLFKKLSQFKPDAILFAAGQIAVTTSIKTPR